MYISESDKGIRKCPPKKTIVIETFIGKPQLYKNNPLCLFTF